jgi:hypothetical protein
MATTKLSTDVIDLSGNTEALTIPKGTTATSLDVEYLVVAGGGGGGWLGGGGGAGGYLTNYTGTAMSINAATSYTVTVGTGGTGATGSSGSSSPGAAGPGGSGNNSVFNTITATGGGGGGSHSAINATTGGSGGGGGSFGGSGASTSDATQGNDGGANSTSSSAYGAGGGGGSAAVGASGSGSVGGNGGAGTQNNIDGNNYFYAAGGGGGAQLTNTAGTGGSSIGGNGANAGLIGYAAPVSNRGSGGGGGGYTNTPSNLYGNGGTGSSGVITLSYPTVNTLTVGSGLYGDYSTGTTGQCSWPTSSNGVSLFQLENNITDTCGNSTASWSGTPAYNATAKFGSYSAEFSGGTGGTYIDTGVDPDASSNWTVSMWIYRTDTSAFDWLFGSLDGSLNNGFGMAFYNQASQGKFDVYLRNASGGNVWRTQGSGTRFNNWEHVALTYNNSGSGTTTIYHNGKPITATFGSNPATGSFASATNWYLGSAGTWNLERFNGYIDQARFYDTDLTATEIELLYNETANATTGTIGSNTWSSFIGGTGTVSFAAPASGGSGRPTSPTEGLMRENTTTGKMEFYDGSLWQEINDTASSYSPDLIPSANFNTVLYSGTSSTPTVVTGVGFKPDFTWLKARNNSWPHGLFSSLMPIYATTGGHEYVYSDRTDDSEALWGSLQFDDDGWSGLAGSYNGTFAHDFGKSGYNYLSWNWKAGGAATTISGVGTINSDVSANTAAGFSIVKYTGDGSAGTTIAHGLGGSPEIVFSKSLDSAYSWNVFNHSLPTNYMMKLDTTGSAFDGSAGTNGGAYTVSSTLLTIVGGASTQNNNNASGDDFIAYCWRSIPGYSKIGFYIGTETTQNIYMGFKPAWIMLKSTTSGAGNSYWTVFDNKRNPSNPRTCEIYPNSADTEYCTVGSSPNYRGLNFTDTGIELLSTSYNNEAFETFIYMAFSE